MTKRLEVYDREKYAPDATRLLDDPEEWDTVLGRMPAHPGVPRAELIVAHQGRLYDFDDFRVPRWPGHLSPVMEVEGLGHSRGFKSRSFGKVTRTLNGLDIPVEVLRERPPGLFALYDPQTYNYVLALGAAMRETDRRSAFRNGGWITRIPKFLIQDRGSVSARLFNEIYKKYGMGDPIVDALAERQFGWLDLILHLRIPKEVSITRGSRLSMQMHEELETVHGRLPDIAAALSRPHRKPIVLAQIDASASLNRVAEAVMHTLGTVATGMSDGRL